MVDTNLQENDSLHLLGRTFSTDIKWKNNIELIARFAINKVG